MEITARQAKEIDYPGGALVCVTVTIWQEAQRDPDLSLEEKGTKTQTEAQHLLWCHSKCALIRQREAKTLSNASESNFWIIILVANRNQSIDPNTSEINEV